MKEDTREKYSKTWVKFITAHGITAEKEPVEDDFLHWFSNSKAAGHGYATLSCEYSHLQKVRKTTFCEVKIISQKNSLGFF